MSLPDAGSPPLGPKAIAKIAAFHPEIVEQVRRAVAEHDVVVVGMAWNANVPRARKALDAAGITHHYLEFGNYITGWRPRLALKLWANWPTFPQVYVRGVLIGGADQTEESLADGTLKAALTGARAATAAP